MVGTDDYLFKMFNSKRVPRWLIRYERLFKIIYKISILYLILNILIACFSLSVWYLISAGAFFVINRSNLLLVEIVKGLLLGQLNGRTIYDDKPLLFLSIVIRIFQIALMLGLLILLILGVRIMLI